MRNSFYKPGSEGDMENKGFIFTMDAILAIIPVFIVLASVSSISYSDNLFGQVFMTGGERVSNDVLKVLDIKGVLNETNCTQVNDTLNNFIPPDYYFNYQLIYNSTDSSVPPSILCNLSSGNITLAEDIAASRRVANAKFYAVLADMLDLSHLSVEGSPPCCMNPGGAQGGPAKREYNSSFYVAPGEPDQYTYWLVGVSPTGNPSTKWGIDPYHNTSPNDENFVRCEPLCQGGGLPPFKPPNYNFTIQIDDYITEDALNILYVWVGAGPTELVDFWVIRAPPNPDPADITPENAQLYSWVVARIEVWQK
jgi:hypothetical protein